MVSFENCQDIYNRFLFQKWIEYMVRVSSTTLESMVTTPFGKDYGFKCTCITGSTKFPKSLTTSEYLSGDRSTPIPIIFVGKSRLGVVSRIN
ncbi:hypothetical protein MTR_2g037535 [Medicago truncatula]|uniref:Uncharacterized protein n=1 Tax=Medicago truncatula TaxID=3880 RepID=A0A072VH26_MEDTR|nr:hypothetical protein MTR_2g037535 [Medicago truncatula]